METLSKFAIFYYGKPSDFRFVTWLMSILKFGLPRLSFVIFPNKKKELFQAISVSPKRDTKNNNFELVLSRQICQRNHVLNYASEKGLDAK